MQKSAITVGRASTANGPGVIVEAAFAAAEFAMSRKQRSGPKAALFLRGESGIGVLEQRRYEVI